MMAFVEASYGLLWTTGPLAVAVALVLLCLLGFVGAPLWLWTLTALAALWGWSGPKWVWVAFGIIALVLNVRPVRRLLVSAPLMGLLRRTNLLPKVSDTEQIAIEAGTVWIEGELFSGKPDVKRLNSEPYPELSGEERAFLDGPVQAVCDMAADWDLHMNGDLPDDVWAYLKEHRFFGMIIPKQYGGLEFSSSANSAVVGKLASRSMSLCITVMVPNSLGPAELLIHYGTQEQREYYLPKLARGEELPCFALTEAEAGSDAGGMRASGIVFRGEDGATYLRLNWQKRYITLAPVATVLGLAFRLHDPDNLLGKGETPGITCALIPIDTPGVAVGRRHAPMSAPFQNGPTEGSDVIMSVDCIIGGTDGVGRGWQMLTECLAAGRGISLPALATAGTKLAARVASAHAVARVQFGLSIGRFEGIEEPLARIGGFAYLLEAVRRYTCGSLDHGAKPAVATAIAKYNCTELFRRAINDGMDILAGNAIMRGPRNLLDSAYSWSPILITAEGANILTRTMIVFGQGAIRCHPYAYRVIGALKAGDTAAFDRAFSGHMRHFVRNLFRAVLLSLSRGLLAGRPVSGPAAGYWRKLLRVSASFALVSDVALMTLGGSLKKKEKITGRLADIFSWMYLGTAVLRRFEAEGRRAEDLPFLHWCMRYALARTQSGFDALFRNLDMPALKWLFRGPVALWSRLNRISSMPSDELGGAVARAIQTPGRQRDELTAGIYLPTDPKEPLSRLERAFTLSHRSEAIDAKIRSAIVAGTLPRDRPARLVTQAVEAGVLDDEDVRILREAEEARQQAIAVDSFDPKEYPGKSTTRSG